MLAPIWLALLLATIWTLYGLWLSPPGNGDTLANRVHYLAIVGLMTALAGLVGTPLALIRVFTKERQTKAAEEGLVTERINKAVEGLGAEKTISRVWRNIEYMQGGIKQTAFQGRDEKTDPEIAPHVTAYGNWEIANRTTPNLEVRIGAIYALERISQDSPRDHVQIMEILCAYIRENAPAKSLEPMEKLEKRASVRIDIQTAITVLGRRSANARNRERDTRFRLDLRNADLSGVDMRRGNFAAAMFHFSRLEAALLDECDLTATQFHGALLNHSSFSNAKLKGTSFDRATVNRPVPQIGGMNDSISLAEIHGVSVAGADISAWDYLGEVEDLRKIFGTGDTVLCDELEYVRNQAKGMDLALRKAIRKGSPQDILDAEAAVDGNAYSHWFEHSYSDGARGWSYYKFLDDMGLYGWPYR